MANIEIMAPAGSFESLRAAIQAGADSVYFGVGNLNMRSRSANFTLDDLNEITNICSQNNVKSYLALNTIVYDSDIKLIKEICDKAKDAKVNSVIASDISVVEYANSIGLPVHYSTQMNIGNIEAIKFFSKFSDVMVLARELTLDQIKSICSQIKKQNIKGPSGNLVKIEVFCHGALCVSISGKCYMSLSTYNSSANRGECFQNCRRSYKVIDEETGNELVIDNKFVMSPKDLCTIGMMDKLIDAGVLIFKIEGRGRSPEYVHTTTKVYKEAVQSVLDKTYSKEKIKKWRNELKTVYNRGFWEDGYYLGKKLGEWSGTSGSMATEEKTYAGKVNNYFSLKKVAEVHLEAASLNLPSKILIIGPTTGIIKMELSKLMLDDKEATKAGKKDIITFEIPDKVRKNDKVYVVSGKKVS